MGEPTTQHAVCRECRRRFTYTYAGRGARRHVCGPDCRAARQLESNRRYRPAVAPVRRRCVRCRRRFTARGKGMHLRRLCDRCRAGAGPALTTRCHGRRQKGGAS
jgi:hypothetical protein